MLDRGYSFTSLENAVKAILDELGLEYAPQLPTRTGFIVDFAVFCSEGRKVALEVDGEVWHSNDRARKRDRFKDYQLKREGWEVLRIKEQEVDDPLILREKLAVFFARRGEARSGKARRGKVWRGEIW